jgi:branched-chain amino acid transport system ATP-binding protein
MTARLEIKDLCLAFGKLIVASNIGLTLDAGARTALIGPNGAGKTTLVDMISGILKPQSGRILLEGEVITNLPPAARARRGIVRTYQISRLFKDMTVADNIRVAILQRTRTGMRLWQGRARAAAINREIDDILDLLGLRACSSALIRSISLGQQRLVEIAIALAMRPRLLLLDEPAAGVPQSEIGIILDAIAGLPAELAVLLIEHDMDIVFRFANRIIVLASGTVLMDGTPAEVARDPRVEAIYFGRAEHGRAAG